MIDNLFKRVIAYFIDMMLVSIVVNSIISSNVVNFQLNNYEKLYKEYYDVYTLYTEQYNNKLETCEDLEKAIEEKKLTEDKFLSDYEKLNESYSKQEISQEEYDSKCLFIVDDYNSNKMTDEFYNEQVDYYYYNLEKNSVVGYLFNIGACILYFVFFQGFTGGQTLGKKIMRLKIVSNKDNKKVSYKQLLVRTLLLPINTMFQNTIYCLLMLVAILAIPKNLFGQVTDILYFISYLISLGIIFTIAFYKGKVGLHDMLGHTKVIYLDFKGNEINSSKKVDVEKEEYKENTENKVKNKTRNLNKSNKKIKDEKEK